VWILQGARVSVGTRSIPTNSHQTLIKRDTVSSPPPTMSELDEMAAAGATSEPAAEVTDSSGDELPENESIVDETESIRPYRRART
jgi:hypothetical protein